MRFLRFLSVCVLFSICAVWAEPIADGFYSVLRKDPVSQRHEAVEPDQARLEYNPVFLDTEQEQRSIVVERGGFVPILLSEAPTKTADQTDRTQFWLHISLAQESAQHLEDFTRKHLGGTVAVVVGGKVVTMHGIKDVIKGGKLQISRCGDDGCKILFRELKDNLEP
jgi:preprotein translocase subunit SecD